LTSSTATLRNRAVRPAVEPLFRLSLVFDLMYATKIAILLTALCLVLNPVNRYPGLAGEREPNNVDRTEALAVNHGPGLTKRMKLMRMR
jgi:hypothetical protein